MATLSVITAFLILEFVLQAHAEEFCGPLPDVRGLLYDIKTEPPYPVGTNTTYKCDYGFVARGRGRMISCVLPADGSDEPAWTEPEITCRPQSCGDPGIILNGRRIGSVFAFPHNITYECDEGYNLVGSRQRFCQTTGLWSGTPPFCQIIHCRQPDDPENGKVTYGSLEYGSELSYECNKGFLLEMPMPRVCSSSGDWTGEEPTCKGIPCDYPIAPTNGEVSIIGGKPLMGSIAVFSCNAGYQLVGSLSSKCLKTGDWSFPPPKCTEPCTIPAIKNGKIGEYVKKYRYQKPQFKEPPEGSAIKYGTELYLKCDSKRYEVIGLNVMEHKVTCNNGVWSHQPVCTPASCRYKAPKVANAQLITEEISHGTVLTYICNQPFVKKRFGRVICDHGVWKGNVPICNDTRCYIDQNTFKGVSIPSKKVYQHGESFTPSCLNGYQLKNDRVETIKCDDGKWEAKQPCIPSHCEDPPPVPQNGAIVSSTKDHLSVVSYKCNQFYEISSRDTNDKVQCSFGKWIGSTPICKDTRCYLKDFSQYEGINTSSTEPVLSTKYAHITCKEGYDLMYDGPRCLKGEWHLGNGISPCQPKDCVVPKYEKGTLMQLIYVRKYSWSRFRMVEEAEWSPVFPGSNFPHGKKIYLFCKEPLTFEGVRGEKSGEMVCERGEWKPSPTCELPGTYIQVKSSTRQAYLTTRAPERGTQKHSLTAHDLLEKTSVSSTTRSGKEPPVYTEVPQETTADAGKVVGEEIPECFCDYIIRDDNLIASSGGKLLTFGSKVKKGCNVTFHCRQIGSQRLVGAQNLTCTDCNWHSTEFPSCVDPVEGDVVMGFETLEPMEFQVSDSGIISIPRGIALNVTCYTLGREVWPTLDSPKFAQPKYKTSAERNLLISFIDIKETSNQHSGKYQCRTDYGYSNYLNLAVEELKLPYPPEFTDIIPSESSIQLKWSFSLSDSSINGFLLQWYDEPSNVKEYFSKGLTNEAIIEDLNPSTEYKIVLWSLNAYGGSDPISESVRTLDKAKGRSCPLHTIFDILPQGVEPDIQEGEYTENVPVGGVIKITCGSSDMRPLGQPVATCGTDEQWVAPQGVQCVVACGPLKQPSGSDVIIDPIKELYRFGESVTFSCHSGQKLNSSTARIMCLRGVWSSNIVPICIDV